jgi:hypothetical protein
MEVLQGILLSIITSTAEREAAIESAKADALRPKIVGETLQEISQDPEIEAAMFEILENEKMTEGNAHVTPDTEGKRFNPATSFGYKVPFMIGFGLWSSGRRLAKLT